LKARRSYQQHGLHALTRAIKVRGLSGIDGRSQAARALLAWRRELEQDLGGVEHISAQQRAVIDLAATSKLLLDSIDRYLLECDGLVNRRKRSVYPVVLQRAQLADGLARYMAQLGLERRRRPTLDLETYVRQRYGQQSDEIQNSPQDRRSAPAGGAEPDHEASAKHGATPATTQPEDDPLTAHKEEFNA
jgi:hypothetical protein